MLDRSLVLEAVRVTEAAAIAAWELAGRGDEKAADQAAVDAMRTALNEPGDRRRDRDRRGRARRGADALHRREGRARASGPRIDIALDPLEGTTLTAKAMANALAVMAWAPDGHAAATRPTPTWTRSPAARAIRTGVIDLDAQRRPTTSRRSPRPRASTPSEITVCVLDRPRHAEIIASLRDVGARVHLITDGDVAGVINTTDPETGIDLYVGQGGAPEGVLACAALKCVGGQFQGRLVFRNDDERARAERLGITDFDKQVRPARDRARRRHLRRHRRHQRRAAGRRAHRRRLRAHPHAW